MVYGATDSKATQPLINDFSALYPGITVEYNDMNSTEVYNRFISEAAAGGNTADVMWSSAMDLQIKLASDGYAMAYKSVEASKIPGWAMWNDMAYGTTFEPAAIVYNKRLVTAAEVPKTHADFAKLITAEKFKDKVTTYDIEKSGVGFMFMTQDSHEYAAVPGARAGLRRGPRARAVVDRHHARADFVGREPDRLQRARLLRAGARQDRSVDRHRAAEGLHADPVARPVHQQGRQERQRGEAVDRLHAVAARPDHHRQRLEAVCDPRRRQGRDHLGRPDQDRSARRTSSRCRSARSSCTTWRRPSAWPS